MNTSTPMQIRAPAPIPEQAIPHQRLEQFPIAFSRSSWAWPVFTLAWQKAHIVLGVPPMIGAGLRGTVSALFIILLVLCPENSALSASGHHGNAPPRENQLLPDHLDFLLLAIAYLESAPEARHSGYGSSVLSCIWGSPWSSSVVGCTIPTTISSTPIPPGSFRGRQHYRAGGWSAVGLPELELLVLLSASVWFGLLTIVLYRLFFHERD